MIKELNFINQAKTSNQPPVEASDVEKKDNVEDNVFKSAFNLSLEYEKDGVVCESKLSKILNSCNSAYDIGEFFSAIERISPTVNFVKQIIEKIFKIIENENFNSESLDWILGECQLQNKWFSQVEKIILDNIDFNDNKNFLNTKRYLDFLKNLYNYSDDTTHVFIKQLAKIRDKIGVEAEKSNSNYFLSLLGKKIIKELSNPFLNPATDERSPSEESNEPGRVADHLPEQLPFLIAPNIYARFDEGNIFISDKNDYEIINRALQRLNFLADRIFTGYRSSGAKAGDLFSLKRLYHNGDIDHVTVAYLEKLINEQGNFIYDQKEAGEYQHFNKNYSDDMRKYADVELGRISFRINHQLDTLDVFLLKNNKSNQGEDLNDFKSLAQFEIRNIISRELGLSLNELQLNEQFYFLNFVKSVTNKQAGKMIEFVKKYGKAGVKTFLSIENSGRKMGDKILNIGGYLKNQPETAELLFSEYAQLADSTEKTAEEVSRIYNEIFFEKQVDKNQITDAILKRASQLLRDAAEKLKDTPENDKQALVKELIEELVKEQMAQARMLEDFERLAENLNTLYNKLGEKILGVEAVREMQEMRDGAREKFREDHARMLDFEHIKSQKYDSQRLKEMIDLYKQMYILSDYDAEIIKEASGFTDEDIRRIRKSQEKEDRPKYEPVVIELERLLGLQESLENKMDQAIYGKKQTKDEQNLDQSLPAIILNKYQELVNLTNKNKKELAGLFKSKVDINQADIDKITGDILIKAKECLDSFNELIEKGGKADEVEILKNLEKYKADMILTASVYKILSGRGDIKLEDIKGVSFEQTTAERIIPSPRVIAALEKEVSTDKNLAIPASAFKGKITEAIRNLNSEETRSVDEIVQMLYIYSENYKHKPEFSDKLLPGFLEKLKTGGDAVRVYKVMKGGQLIAFYRFDDMPDGNKYFGSFNVNPAVKGYKIGTALMEESLEKEGIDCDIEADTDPETLISSKYIEDEGFVATEVLKNYGGSTDSVFNIHRRDDNKKYYYRDQDYKSGDIIKQYEKEFGGVNTSRQEGKIIFKFSSPREMMTAIEPLVNNGYAVTRYFYEDPKKGQTVYCALERSAS